MAQRCGSRKLPEESDDSGPAASQLISGIGSFRQGDALRGRNSEKCELRGASARGKSLIATRNLTHVLY
jgi:hypothetical protein